MLHGDVIDGHVHLGALRVPGADHLEEGTKASAFIRPHDVRISDRRRPIGAIYATVERVASLGWLARLTLRFPDDTVIVAHVPQDELNGAGEGDTISVDLRNPKAFQRGRARRGGSRHVSAGGISAASRRTGGRRADLADIPVDVLRFAMLPEERRTLLIQVNDLLEEIDYGTVVIVMHDGKVIQIEMSEKVRLTRLRTPATSPPDCSRLHGRAGTLDRPRLAWRENSLHIDWAIALASVLVGFTVGLTGMGGGALMTPILLIFFGISPTAAVSSDLVAAMVMKPVGGGVHVRRKTVRWELVRWLCIGSIPAAFSRGSAAPHGPATAPRSSTSRRSSWESR